ncbi:MAG TPA: hypothetical protein VEH09_03260 [Thermodesulfobacteriota bacterium]|nr:hypothetical protein [Thermodesulfobacteriota bacterium]
MNAFEISIIAGFLLGSLCVWLVHFVNDRYTKGEKKVSLLLLKRAKRY